MQNPNPYLSVAIPTYNRRNELIECLRSIVPQAKRHSIRVYISDNASNYDVTSVVEGFRKDYPLIYYSRNLENVGLDANVRKVISMVESSYVWVFSDDDFMVDGALDIVLPYCQKKEFAWIVPNRELRSGDLSAPMNYQSWFDSTRQIYTDYLQLFINYGCFHYAFVGSLIIRLEEWYKVPAEKYVHCKFFESMCILGEMMLTNKAIALPNVLIYLRMGQTSYADQSWMVWGYYFPLALSELPKMYTLSARKKVLFEVPILTHRPFIYMFLGRSLGFVTWKTINNIARPYYQLGCISWCVAGYLALVFPPKILFQLRRIMQYFFCKFVMNQGTNLG